MDTYDECMLCFRINPKYIYMQDHKHTFDTISGSLTFLFGCYVRLKLMHYVDGTEEDFVLGCGSRKGGRFETGIIDGTVSENPKNWLVFSIYVIFVFLYENNNDSLQRYHI